MAKEKKNKTVEDWKETIIKTDVDRLLKYLVDQGSANTKRISKDLGIPEETIILWSNALSSSKLIEKEYSTKGVILKVGSKNQKVAKEKIDEVSKEIGKKIKNVKKKVHGESDTIIGVKKELEKLGTLLEKDRNESQFLEKRILSLKEEQISLKKELLKDIKDEREIETEITQVLDDVHKTLKELKDTEKILSEFISAKRELDKDLSTLRTLKSYKENINTMEKKKESISEKEKRTTNLFAKVMKSLGKIGKEKNG